jgi:hypothetical protein
MKRLLLLVLFAVAACDRSPHEPTQPALTFVAGTAQIDTIDATLADPIVVEVRRADNAPAVGVNVRFENAVSHFPTPMLDQLMLVAPNGATVNALDVVTDQNGRAAVRVRLGSKVTDARSGILRAIVAEFGMTAEDTLQVLTGQPTRATILGPNHVMIGTAFTPTIMFWDREINLTPPAPFTFDSVSAQLAVTSNGDSLRAVAAGAARATIGTAFGAQSFSVTVLPDQVLVGTQIEPGGNPLRIIQSDGTHGRVLPPGFNPDWSPQGNAIVFVRNSSMFITDTLGNERALLPHIAVAGAPRWGVSDEIFYSVLSNPHEIWSVRPDGSNNRRIYADSSATIASVDPAPDGRRLAFNRGDEIVIYDMTDATIRTLVTGSGAEWSPSGEWIVYAAPVTGAAVFLRGPTIRTISPSGVPGRVAFATGSTDTIGTAYYEWTADGQFVLIGESLWFGGGRRGRWTLVEHSSGTGHGRVVDPHVSTVAARPN